MSPWGWECRARLVKQVKTNPTQKRTTKWDGFITPGPANYTPPDVFCGPGFSKIKRAPAYSFGLYTPIRYAKPAALPKAPVFNISGLTRKGAPKIKQGIIGEKCSVPGDKTLVPGPGAYSLKDDTYLKKPPAYSMRIAAKPPYEPWDMWTPSANMYWPPIPGKKSPAYSFGDKRTLRFNQDLPGPGQHDPKFTFVKSAQPAFSFGYRHRLEHQDIIPAPNAYCEKRYMYAKRSSPAPSFGIRHSPYLGKGAVYEMPSRLELLARDLV